MATKRSNLPAVAPAGGFYVDPKFWELAPSRTYAENPPDDWEDCGQCGGAHPPGYTGDCRSNINRWPSEACIAALTGNQPQTGLGESAMKTEQSKLLRDAAQKIETAASQLDRSFAPCPHCGTRRMNNFNQYQMGVELDAMAAKLRRFAASGAPTKGEKTKGVRHADQAHDQAQ